MILLQKEVGKWSLFMTIILMIKIFNCLRTNPDPPCLHKSMLPLKIVTKLYKIKVYALAFNNPQDALTYPSLIDEVCLKWASMKCIWCFLERHEWVAMDWDILRLGCGLGLGVIIIAWNWGGYKQQSFTCDRTALFVAQDSNISTWPFCLGSFTLYLSQFIYVQNLFTIVLGIWFTIFFQAGLPCWNAW